MIDEQTANDVAAALRLVGDDVNEDTAPLLRLLADRLDGAPAQDDDEPGDLEQESRPAMPSFDEVVARRGGYSTTVLQETPLIQEMPLPGEHRDSSADLADLFLEVRGGVRTELPAHDGALPLPNLDPPRETTSGIELTLEGAPIPADTIQQPAQLLQEPLSRPRPMAVRVNTEFSGEFAAGGAPIPSF